MTCAVLHFWRDVEKRAQSAGFEPARAEPNGFLVHRLNHSATTAMKFTMFIIVFIAINDGFNVILNTDKLWRDVLCISYLKCIASPI